MPPPPSPLPTRQGHSAWIADAAITYPPDLASFWLLHLSSHAELRAFPSSLPLPTRQGHSAWIADAAITREGSYVVTVSGDSTGILWDTASSECHRRWGWDPLRVRGACAQRVSRQGGDGGEGGATVGGDEIP